MDNEVAIAKCNSIVIHGDILAKIHAAEDVNKDDDGIEDLVHEVKLFLLSEIIGVSGECQDLL